MSEKVNIKRIAELSGVSAATVSRVINQNGRFSAETEAKVKQIIEEYHYVPNVVAKGLRTNHTKVIGVIVPDILNAHFAKLVLEIEKELFKHSYSTLICNTNESSILEKKHIYTLIAQQVSGIIFISGSKYYSVGDSIPTVYVDRRPYDFNKHENVTVIESDNETGAYLATKSLIDKKCNQIGILQAIKKDYNQKARYSGYKKAMKEACRNIKSELVINLNEVSIGAAKETIKELYSKGTRFDGLICNTDDLAIGAIMGLKECGLGVPDDVLVTGFDDTELASAYEPSLTSVHQYVNNMGKQAVDIILDLIAENEIVSKHVIIPVRLMERESTNKKD